MSSDKTVGNLQCTVTLSKGGQCPESAVDGDGLCKHHRTLREKKIAKEVPKIRAWAKITFGGAIFGRDIVLLHADRQRIKRELTATTTSTSRRAGLEGELDAIDAELARQAALEPAGVK